MPSEQGLQDGSNDHGYRCRWFVTRVFEVENEGESVFSDAGDAGDGISYNSLLLFLVREFPVK